MHNSVSGYRAPRSLLETDVCIEVATCRHSRESAKESYHHDNRNGDKQNSDKHNSDNHNKKKEEYTPTPSTDRGGLGGFTGVSGGAKKQGLEWSDDRNENNHNNQNNDSDNDASDDVYDDNNDDDDDNDDDDELFLFSTLSNSQKIDPAAFHVWMNILRRFPHSKMVITA